MTTLAIVVSLAQLSRCQKQKEVIPYDEYNFDEENGGEEHGSEYTARSDVYVGDLRAGSAALSVRNSTKLYHTTCMMSMRSMAVKTLAVSTQRVRYDEYVRNLGDVSEALSVKTSRKLYGTTRIMLVRRMTVRTLTASTTASKMR
jgi:hypothetical protein